MIFDSADYYFIDFQSDLPKGAAYTHIGMYAAWLALRGLGSTDLNDYLYHLRTRRMSCGEFLAEACDGKLGTQDVNAEGQAFSEDYYAAHFRADYERLFKAEFGRSGHQVDDFCSLPDSWHNFDRLAPVLNRRWMDWKAVRNGVIWAPMPAVEEVFARVQASLQPFLDQAGFAHDPASEPAMMDGPAPNRAGRLFRTDYPGGRHWLLIVVKSTAQGAFTLSLVVASCLDAVAERIRDHGLPEYFRDTPDDPLPYTAILRLSQWLRADPQLVVELDDDDDPVLVMRSPEDLATVLPVLSDKLHKVMAPLLARLGTLKGLDALRCHRPLSESILYTEPFNRLVLSTAEVAGNPRILELCDELEALGTDPHAPGMYMYLPNLLAHIRQVRERHTSQ